MIKSLSNFFNYTLLIVTLILLLCLNGYSNTQVKNIKETAIDNYWASYVHRLTNQSLWTEDKAYNASHFLMTPMYYAYLSNDVDKIRDFDTLFEKFNDSQVLPKSRLNRLQWLYFVSNYLSIKQQTQKKFSISDEKLLDFITLELEKEWYERLFKQWEKKPFIGERDRVDYILNNKNPRFSYYTAFFDQDQFILGIASDLKYIYDGRNLQSKNTKAYKIFNEIISKDSSIIKQRGKFTPEGGYLFQVGTWQDHNDYKYSGNSQINGSLIPKTLPNVAEDSSHSHRMPLVLRSLYRATGDEEIKRIINGYAYQFNHVMIARDYNICHTNEIFLNNFTDGRNGVYRYNYKKGINRQNGYGPYELSGILLIGWYSFLPNSEQTYDDFQQAAPLSKCAKDVYLANWENKNATNPLSLPFIVQDARYNIFYSEIQYYISKKFNVL